MLYPKMTGQHGLSEPLTLAPPRPGRVTARLRRQVEQDQGLWRVTQANTWRVLRARSGAFNELHTQFLIGLCQHLVFLDASLQGMAGDFELSQFVHLVKLDLLDSFRPPPLRLWRPTPRKTSDGRTDHGRTNTPTFGRVSTSTKQVSSTSTKQVMFKMF